MNGAAAGGVRQDASQERPTEQSQSNLVDDDEDDMAFDNQNSGSTSEPQPV